MKRLVVAAVVALGLLLAGSAVASADPYTDQLCMNNPAYASMHENECGLEGHHGVPAPGSTGGPGLGGLGGLLHSIPIVGGLL